MRVFPTSTTLHIAIVIWGCLMSQKILANEHIAFVACPIARDIGPQSDVCFIAEYNGKTYGLFDPNGYNRPMLKHKVMVEGEVIDGEMVCGATRIKGVLSVMREEISPECNQILPDDGSVRTKNNNLFLRMPEEHRQRAFKLMAEVADNPEASLQEAIYDPAPFPPVKPPYERQTLNLHYPFNSKRSSGPELRKLLHLIHYSKFSGGHFLVRSYQGASRLDNGEVMEEKSGMAQERAAMFAELLTELGINKKEYIIEVQSESVAATGVEDWKNRRISVELNPAE